MIRESDLERLEPGVIWYDGAPLSDVTRTLLRAFESVNDFGDAGLSATSLGATDGANIFAFHHQLARNEYRKIIVEARQELAGFLSSMRGIGRDFDDADGDMATQMRMLHALVAGTSGGVPDRRTHANGASHDPVMTTGARL